MFRFIIYDWIRYIHKVNFLNYYSLLHHMAQSRKPVYIMHITVKPLYSHVTQQHVHYTKKRFTKLYTCTLPLQNVIHSTNRNSKLTRKFKVFTKDSSFLI